MWWTVRARRSALNRWGHVRKCASQSPPFISDWDGPLSSVNLIMLALVGVVVMVVIVAVVYFAC